MKAILITLVTIYNTAFGELYLSILYMDSIGIKSDDAYFVGEMHTLKDLSI